MFSSTYFNDTYTAEMAKKKRSRKAHRRGGSKRRAKRSGGGCTTKTKHGKVVHGQVCEFTKAQRKCFTEAGGKHNFDFSVMKTCMSDALK